MWCSVFLVSTRHCIPYKCRKTLIQQHGIKFQMTRTISSIAVESSVSQIKMCLITYHHTHQTVQSAICGLLQSVSLGPELYLAPEMMYTSLGLPQAILDVTNGLPVNTLKECLCHILLTGTVQYSLRDRLMWPCSILQVNTDIVSCFMQWFFLSWIGRVVIKLKANMYTVVGIIQLPSVCVSRKFWPILATIKQHYTDGSIKSLCV